MGLAALVLWLAAGSNGPIVLADTSVQLQKHVTARLRLEIPDAKVSPSRRVPICDSPASGRLHGLVMVDGREPVTTDLARYFGSGEVEFCGYPFEIAFADYNNDGQVDFNLRNFSTSNGSCYRLFTINPDLTIGALPLPRGGLACSASEENSTKSFQLTDDGFATSGHDPATGMFRIRYRWDRGSRMFVVAEEHFERPTGP